MQLSGGRIKLIIDVPNTIYEGCKQRCAERKSRIAEFVIAKGVPYEERPQGERAERALAIIDRLRTDGHINNKEQGTLRRAILLPERSQGVWTTVKGIEGAYYCSECDGDIDWKSRYCPWCGAKMEVDYE